MKMKKIGILICIILIVTISYPVSADTVFEEKEETKSNLGFEIWIINAKIDNLTEEIIDGKMYYTFHADYFRGFVFGCYIFGGLHLQRINEEDIITGFLKRNFIGLAGENYLFGIVCGIVN